LFEVILFYIVLCLHIKLVEGPVGIRRIFPEGKTSTFGLSFSGCWRCNAIGHTQNAFTFLYHKAIAPSYGNSHKTTLLWQQ